VRKLFLFGFLGLMCYHLLGFFTYFEWKRMSIKKEVKHAIKHAVPESQLIRFHFTFHETQQLKWVKFHEFILNGHYYDVIHKAKNKNGYFFKCISDDQETVLFSQLRSITAFSVSHSGENQPVNVWFKFLSEPMEVVHTSLNYAINVFEQKSSLFASHEEWSYSLYLSTETPPPDFIS
jgi:hypothetical protein